MLIIIVVTILAFAAGFMARPYIWSQRIMTLSDYRKKPYQ
jgi:hypothetical protein